MKNRSIEPGWLLVFGLVAAACVFAFPLHPANADVTMLIEAEDFQFFGGWIPSTDKDAFQRRFLRPSLESRPVIDAMTAVTLPVDNQYHVWVRGRDFATQQPKTRRYKIAIDGAVIEGEAGCHGNEGWAWQQVGTVDLTAGDHMLGLRLLTSPFARCDAVLLTTTELDPNSTSRSALARRRVLPKTLQAEASLDSPRLPKLNADAPTKTLASLTNEKLRVTFSGQADETGALQVVRATSLNVADQWRALPCKPQGERLFVLYDEKATASYCEGEPLWNNSASELEVQVADKTYTVSQGASSPFAAGKMSLLIGRAAKQIDERTVEVTYETIDGQTAVGRWSIAPGEADVKVELSFDVPKVGYYSVGFSAFGDITRSQTQFVQLPPRYQFQRLPDRPRMLTETATPHAMALVQTEWKDTTSGNDTNDTATAPQSVCLVVTAEPKDLPLRWPTTENPAYGFALLNAENRVQPSVFCPVLGFEASRWEPGEKHTVAWRVLAFPGDWMDALEYVSDDIMQVRDYRKPTQASLSQAAVNMIDLMRNADAAGWSSELKGFWNIEMESTVTQASPLTIVAASLLSRDEKLYAERALPTIEFTLTRPSAHWRRPSTEPVRLKVPIQFYGTPYWQGLHALLGDLNPWLKEFALPQGDIYHSQAYNASPEWSDLLAKYRWKPDEALLKEICKQADEFIATALHGRHERPIGYQPFYNIHFYPYWWDLISLYEITGEKRYLKAAEEGAFHTMAGQWSHPMVPNGSTTVHPDGEFHGLNPNWWKDDVKYRLGDPREPGDTPAHEVPAWTVARVGLGLEQPSTYFSYRGFMRNILMSVWAPHLLRVAQHTDRPICETYARNSIIGRFANYPGYYVVGYSDLTQDPNYPYRGPDVSGIYYHHIPPHLAFTVDFLVAQAGARSQGKISFPWVMQQGYAWFTNRVYGMPGGEIFGQDAGRLLLDGKAVQVDDKNIDWLASRSDDRFWLILMSQSDQPLTVAPKLDAGRLGLKSDTPYVAYTVDKPQGVEQPADRLAAVTVPPKGLVAISLAAEPKVEFPLLPPLEQGHVVADAGSVWGQAHAFRIRSPFGSDSVYVALTAGPVEGGSVTVKIAGRDEPLVKKQLPYEFSVYPWPIDQPCELVIETHGPEQTEPQTISLTLPGTPREVASK